MADKLGISQKAYNNLENKQSMLSVKRLIQIGSILDLDHNLLMK
jgi:transcriptional regulator with XRE-family HTH domain